MRDRLTKRVGKKVYINNDVIHLPTVRANMLSIFANMPKTAQVS